MTLLLFFDDFSSNTNPSGPSSAEKDRERDKEQERREKESRDRERALLDKLKEERDKNKIIASKTYREGGSGNMVALTAHAHSQYGRESYTPLGGNNNTNNYNNNNNNNNNNSSIPSRVEYTNDRPSLSNLFSPAMRYISPMKSVPVVSSPAPFVVRHAQSDFISGSVIGSPSVSYPLNTVSRSAEGLGNGNGNGSSGGVMRISKSAATISSSNKFKK